MFPTILLWDIDGTLIHTGGAGMEAWRRSLEEMCCAPTALPDLPTAGLTDVLIARKLAEAVGLPADGHVMDQLLVRYLELLPGSLGETPGYVLPNVREILEATDRRDDVHCLLLTGNVAAGARIKLRHFGLLDHFAGGRFADGTDDRNEVAHRAAADVRTRFADVPGDRMFVLGDTPADVACGHAIGARTIAVATGPYDTVALEARSPWCVFDQLPDAGPFLDLVADATCAHRT